MHIKALLIFKCSVVGNYSNVEFGSQVSGYEKFPLILQKKSITNLLQCHLGDCSTRMTPLNG